MDKDKSYFEETSKSLISESEKLEKSLDHMSKKSGKFSINEIIPLYYQIINVTSLIQFLRQNISKAHHEKTSSLLKKIDSTENLIINNFNTCLHPMFLSYLIDAIQNTMVILKSKEEKEKTKDYIESKAELYDLLRQMMSTKEFVEQYEKGLSHD